ncbi:MAG: hypothetical protein KKC30_12800 [Proteobacteria bacterium]|nr:hypothetical protein [Pseudomonadota bacterium]MBU4384585.1 hypothetical protein [Pseudomonadota bacterium]MBU4606829.1 hypothetical protein [Pseudomonadota bacterium]MCG2766267.1 hypothetical protein [Desulfarculaceae bacterium]
MYKFLLFAGWALLIIGIAFVVMGYIGIIVAAPSLWEGLKEVWHLMSPFNVLNFIVTIAALAPGIILITLADKFKGKSNVAKNNPE